MAAGGRGPLRGGAGGITGGGLQCVRGAVAGIHMAGRRIAGESSQLGLGLRDLQKCCILAVQLLEQFTIWSSEKHAG
jgi:hypothetical protein